MRADGQAERRLHRQAAEEFPKGGWTYVVWPHSVKFFGARGLVKVRGNMDGQVFRSSFMAQGHGRHKLPVRAAIGKAIGKKVGQTAKVVLH